MLAPLKLTVFTVVITDQKRNSSKMMLQWEEDFTENIKNININKITFTRAIATMTISAMDLIVVYQVKND